MPTTYLTTTEAAARLGLTPRRVRQLCQAGRLGRKIGRNYAITEAQLAKFEKIERRVGKPRKDEL